ncbi:MAG: glutathione S-transferase [Myxococcales bacterium]|nr:glutathione S-transferase [Myxococcales bacterium]
MPSTASSASALPILYSFRRCPYAMRARLALAESCIAVELREVLLRDKPNALRQVSPKATVPVLVLADGQVLDESLDIMRWALEQHDPSGWLHPDLNEMLDVVAGNDGPFKHHLDRYKYGNRYPGEVPLSHRSGAVAFLETLEHRLADGALFGRQISLADVAIAPFVRQFANTDRVFFDGLALPKVQAWLAEFLSSARFVHTMKKVPRWIEPTVADNDSDADDAHRGVQASPPQTSLISPVSKK